MIFFRQLYLNQKFYVIIVIVILFFIIGNFFSFFFIAGKILTLIFCALFVTDILLLFRKKELVTAMRFTPERLSNSDINEVVIYIKNKHTHVLHITIIDEVPDQFQLRDFKINTQLKPGEEKQFKYSLRPLSRGEYGFGRINIYISGFVRFISRRCIFEEPKIVPVYPSFLQMRKYELLAISNRLSEAGIKKIRSIGRNIEFEHIRKYNTDDDFRSINWKATARKGELMVNQYQEEKSQQVYNIIDIGRVMKMPFGGLSLLDYSINAALVLANISIHKQDKSGLITFSNKLHTFLPAEKRNNQMMKIQDVLYKINTQFEESDYELLYVNLKKYISQRSLVILYSNFESILSMQRQIKYLQMIAKNHLLVVVFFINTEIQKMLLKKVENLEEIYINTIAEKQLSEKKQMIRILQKSGIQAVLTEPENLTVATLNKYLEIKAKGLT